MLRYLFPVRHYDLMLQLIKREILQRFKGSWLGLGWSLLTPLAMLAVYTFVFRTVLNARWPGAPDSDAEFALRVFSGLMIFTLFSETLSRAPTLVTSQPNLVKKVIFPLEILPWVNVGSAYFNTLLTLLVLLLGTALAHGSLSIAVIALPLALGALLPLLLGLGWLLASLGVFLRDIDHIIGLILTPLMFLSPIFYPLDALPASIQPFAHLNPLTTIIEAVRSITLDGAWPDFYALGIYTVVAMTIAVCGAYCFEKTRRGFADVL